jgi:hypothetical protein
MKLPILKFPDDKLRTKARKVETIDDTIKTLVKDMFETMYMLPLQCGWSAQLLHKNWVLISTPRYEFLFLHVIVAWSFVRRILIGRSHPLLHRIENNTARTRNSDLICQGWRGEEQIVTRLHSFEQVIVQPFSLVDNDVMQMVWTS